MSKWNDTHYAWYKHQITTGKIYVTGISEGQPEETGAEETAVQEEALEATLSLERDLHAYYKDRIAELEPGLKLVQNGVEYQTEAGRIDLLARDATGTLVVIELKVGEAKDGAVGQLLGYIGALSTTESNVRGILVASDFESRVKFAAKAIPTITLLRYRLSFSLQPVT